MMRNPLSAYLLTSVCFAAADEARARAEEAKKKQADAEKDRADREKAAADARGGQTVGGDQHDAAADAVKKGQSPASDAEGLDPKALMARLDAQDRLIKTLTAQMEGAKGPALDENKDISAASPGAQMDPRQTRVLPAGVSSAPSTQPIPSTNGGGSGIAASDVGALWGTDSRGGPVQARTYPELEEEDVVVVAAGYHDDTIRSPGEIILGYTGPAASWFVPKDMYDKLGPDEASRRFRRMIANHAARQAA